MEKVIKKTRQQKKLVAQGMEAEQFKQHISKLLKITTGYANRLESNAQNDI